MRVPSPLPLVAVLAVLIGLGGAGTVAPAASGAAAASGSEEAEADRLVAEYAPRLMVREQRDPPCDTSEEQYQPTAVEAVLGNPAVTLRDMRGGGQGKVVARAPTAADVAGRGEGFHLDLPGSPLGDTCVYARDFAKLLDDGAAPAVTYAHIAREEGREGLAVQYWFFWYFNQFNDVHEGDWEGMQIAFESSDPATARREGPNEMILFQHAGGERADWEDSKVEKEGTHAVVYPAAGSHATFYSSTVYLENGQSGSGVGCDNTSEPVRRLTVKPVRLPDRPTTGDGFPWLSYSGRWGQQEKGFNNGPTGPATKTQWTEPFTWMEAQRSTSPRMPGGSVVGPTVTAAFCGAVTAATDLINLEARSPLAAAVTVVVALALIGLFLGVTRWRPVRLEPLRQQRAFGQLVRAARQLYGRHWRALAPIGLAALPIVGGVTALSALFSGESSVGGPAHGGIRLAIADLLSQIGRPIAFALVAAAAIVFVRQLAAGNPVGFRDSWRGMGERFRRVVLGQLAATLAVLLMAVTVIGIPFAIWKFVSWQFVQQQILFEDRSVREAFRASSQLVRGQWWRTVRVASFLWLVSVAAGPILGFALIFTDFSLTLINVIGSLVYCLLLPYVAVGQTLLYFDLEARRSKSAPEPAAEAIGSSA